MFAFRYTAIIILWLGIGRQILPTFRLPLCCNFCTCWKIVFCVLSTSLDVLCSLIGSDHVCFNCNQVFYTSLCVFYDRMTVHRNRLLVNKTNRCTEFHFYWCNDTTCFGQPFCPPPGVLSCTSALVHFMQLCVLPGVGWNCSSILLWQQTVITPA